MLDDVVVVGGGIVGCAIARALAGTNLSVTLVEARDDVGDGTSKANTALLHTGYRRHARHARVATGGARLRAARRLCGADRHPGRTHRRAAGRMDRGGTRRPPGSEGQGRTERLPPLRDRHGRRGVPAGARSGSRRTGRADRARRVDHLHLDHQPRAGHRRGCARCAPAARRAGDRAVVGDGHTTLQTTRGDVRGRWVINAAGLGCRSPRRRVRASPLHRHPAARRAAGVRQADPADGAVHRAGRAVVARQGGAGQPDHLRQRDGRARRRRTSKTAPPQALRRRASNSCCPRAAR